MEDENSPDKLIEALGGCGRFQVRLGLLIHSIKSMVTVSFGVMMVASMTPNWRCISNIEQSVNTSSNGITKFCGSSNITCDHFEFDGTYRTFVSEFSLVCDKAYIPSTVMSAQMAGVFIGNVVSGQIASLVGRKGPLFASMVMTAAANIIGFFSVNWIMFAATRVLVGIGGGFFLSVQYSILCEFTLAKWRSWAIGFPSYPVHASVFALCAYLLDDWRYIQLVGAGLAIVSLFTWSFIPESFRWHYAHDRTDKANAIIREVAEYNNKQPVKLAKSSMEKDLTSVKHQHYTFKHIFQSKRLVKLTLLLAVNWFALGFVTYGIGFGVQALSGNIFLNYFLFNVTGIPAKGIGIWMQNRLGRRKTAFICSLITAIGGFIVGVVQYIETDYRVSITNGFAMAANMGIMTSWGPVQTMTIELYPTVIRTIGFGTLSTMARLGAILGPQFVFLDQFVPGILFFASGVIATLCICTLLGLNETKDSYLDDKISKITKGNSNVV